MKFERRKDVTIWLRPCRLILWSFLELRKPSQYSSPHSESTSPQVPMAVWRKYPHLGHIPVLPIKLRHVKKLETSFSPYTRRRLSHVRRIDPRSPSEQ